MIPNFDDVDLGIIVIGLVMLLVGTTLAFTKQITEGLGFLGGGVTAIATLAGRKAIQSQQAPPPVVPPNEGLPDLEEPKE